MLVPQNTVAAWYRDDSFVFKNFKFLFVNPLWQTRLPRGFSLCPYFWLSMFSLVVFRPFVGLIMGFRWVGRITRLNRAFRAVRRGLSTLFADDDDQLGFSFKLLLFAATGLILLLGLIGLAMGLCIVVNNYIVHECLSALVVPVLMFAVAMVCCAYQDRHKNDPDACNVGWYLRLSTLLGIGTMWCCMPAEFVEIFLGGLSILFLLAGAALIGIWHAAVWLCQTAVAGVVFGGHAVYHVAAMAAWPGLYLLLFGAVVYAAFFLFGLWVPDPVMPETPPVTFNPRTDAERNIRRVWGNTSSGSVSLRTWVKWVKKNMPDYVERFSHLDIYTPDAEPIKQALRNLAASQAAMHEARNAKAARRKEMCRQITGGIGVLFHPVVVAGQWVGRMSCHCARNIWIFIQYMWALVKARKQGVCPYMLFTKSDHDDRT